jgi:MFS transporter, DHA2 family, multidrug resistance protein
MSPKALIAICGIVLAVMSSELDDLITSIALADIRGGLSIDYDATSWFRSLYVTGEMLGMCVAPAFALVVSPRRFALFAISLSCLSNVAFALEPPIPMMYILRFLQGQAEGFIVPLLMMIALRLLGPSIRLYGLALYALTATMVPNLATSVAALWVDGVHNWHGLFWESLPLSALAAILVRFGTQDEPIHWERVRHLDWRGALLIGIGFGSFTTLLLQGDRLDWYDSGVIWVATLISAIAIPLFFINERYAEQPLVRLGLLKRRNFGYGVLCLFMLLIISLSSTQVPLQFLEAVHGYRPLQVSPITAEVAVPQLLLLPAIAWLLDRPRVDARWVSAVGFTLVLLACLYGLQVNSAWTSWQFVLPQALQAIGQPLIVMPLLMLATNVVRPDEGPYAAALVNTSRALSEAIGGWMLELIGRLRGTLHRSRILDQIGQGYVALLHSRKLPMAALSPLSVPPPGGPPAPLRPLDLLIQQQVAVLTTIDTFFILGGLAALMLVALATVPVRTYPPRIALAHR